MRMRVFGVVFALVFSLAAPAAAQALTMRMTGDVVIPAGAVHEGSVVTMNGAIQIDGVLDGDAMTMNGDIAVAGTVTGSVRTLNGAVRLTPAARVDGDVWTANGRVVRQPGAQVGGRVSEGWVFGAAPAPPSPAQPPSPPPWEEWGRWVPGAFFRALAAWVMIGFIAVAAAVAALFPQQINRVAGLLNDLPGQALLAGVLLWVLLPPLVMALILSVVGIPAIAFLPLAISVIGLVGFAAAAMLLGNRITEAFGRHTGPVLDAMVGAGILALLALVPGLGWFAIFVAIIWGMGGVLLLLVRQRRTPPAPA